jgi:chromate transport protein ChrA
MERSQPQVTAGTFREILFAFLKLGATAYGGPAMLIAGLASVANC